MTLAFMSGMVAQSVQFEKARGRKGGEPMPNGRRDRSSPNSGPGPDRSAMGQIPASRTAKGDHRSCAASCQWEVPKSQDNGAARTGRTLPPLRPLLLVGRIFPAP
jgi:hypothetical protein